MTFKYLTQVAQIFSGPPKPASQGVSLIHTYKIKYCCLEAPQADLHKTTQVALLALG